MPVKKTREPHGMNGCTLVSVTQNVWETALKRTFMGKGYILLGRKKASGTGRIIRKPVHRMNLIDTRDRFKEELNQKFKSIQFIFVSELIDGSRDVI